MDKIEGFILTGGASRRMGVPKALLRLGGMTLTERAANTLDAVCDKVFMVGANGSENIEVLEDARLTSAGDRRASLIGLYTALINCRSTLAAVLACGMPFVNSGLVQRMSEIAVDDPSVDGIVPIQPDGRLQPLCAVYHPDSCLPTIRAALESNDWRLQGTIARLKIRRVGFAEVADLEGSENFFFNLNTPADFEIAKKLVECREAVPGWR